MLFRLEDSLNDGLCTNILEFILVNVHLIVAEIDIGESWMVLYNLFDIEGVLRTMELVVFHCERNQSFAVFDSFDNWSEVLLELIV